MTWHHSNSMSLMSKDRNPPSRDHSFGSCVCYGSWVMLCCANHTPFRTEALFPQLLAVWWQTATDWVPLWELPSLEDSCLIPD